VTSSSAPASPEQVPIPVLTENDLPVGDSADAAALATQGVKVDGDVPLQLESEPIPASAKKGRMSWFKGK
jgi:hypothetical protein